MTARYVVELTKPGSYIPEAIHRQHDLDHGFGVRIENTQPARYHEGVMAGIYEVVDTQAAPRKGVLWGERRIADTAALALNIMETALQIEKVLEHV